MQLPATAMKKPRKKRVAERLIDALTEITEKLEKGGEVEVTEVRREETPDGPLHTFEKKKVLFGTNGDDAV